MNNWTELTKEERLTILTNVAENRGIVENAVEKDYWVSMTLRAISSLQYVSALVFKGGTSLSKGWALIERFSEDIDLAGCTHIERITRHMYDIVKMMDKPFTVEAINNRTLYEDIVSHRRQFTAWSGLDYATHRPQTITFVPPIHIEAILRDDYRQMQVGFIYADAPSFDEIMERMRDLQNRFRMLQWDK